MNVSVVSITLFNLDYFVAYILVVHVIKYYIKIAEFHWFNGRLLLLSYITTIRRVPLGRMSLRAVMEEGTKLYC